MPDRASRLERIMTRHHRPPAFYGRRGARHCTGPAAAARSGGDLHAALREHIASRFGDEAGSSDWRGAASEEMADDLATMIEARYQPIARMRDGAVVALEMLARLNHPASGFLLPERFIPEIESAGLSPQLTDLIAARGLASLDPAFIARHGISLAVNLPLDVLLFPAAFDRMEMRRERAGVAAAQLTIELTESRPVIDLPSLGNAVERWRRTGYRLAIDDVGPEMTNHRALFKLPFDAAKLDKDIVQAAAANAVARDFVAATVQAAHAAGLTVTAEGVEDEQAWSWLRAYGADEAQGYLIAKPLAPGDIPNWLETWQRRALPGTSS